jgi:hypothetical protein
MTADNGRCYVKFTNMPAGFFELLMATYALTFYCINFLTRKVIQSIASAGLMA